MFIKKEEKKKKKHPDEGWDFKKNGNYRDSEGNYIDSNLNYYNSDGKYLGCFDEEGNYFDVEGNFYDADGNYLGNVNDDDHEKQGTVEKSEVGTKFFDVKEDVDEKPSLREPQYDTDEKIEAVDDKGEYSIFADVDAFKSDVGKEFVEDLPDYVRLDNELPSIPEEKKETETEEHSEFNFDNVEPNSDKEKPGFFFEEIDELPSIPEEKKETEIEEHLEFSFDNVELNSNKEKPEKDLGFSFFKEIDQKVEESEKGEESDIDVKEKDLEEESVEEHLEDKVRFDAFDDVVEFKPEEDKKDDEIILSDKEEKLENNAGFNFFEGVNEKVEDSDVEDNIKNDFKDVVGFEEFDNFVEFKPEEKKESEMEDVMDIEDKMLSFDFFTDIEEKKPEIDKNLSSSSLTDFEETKLQEGLKEEEIQEGLKEEEIEDRNLSSNSFIDFEEMKVEEMKVEENIIPEFEKQKNIKKVESPKEV
jgi:hypothetical protein